MAFALEQNGRHSEQHVRFQTFNISIGQLLAKRYEGLRNEVQWLMVYVMLSRVHSFDSLASQAAQDGPALWKIPSEDLEQTEQWRATAHCAKWT